MTVHGVLAWGSNWLFAAFCAAVVRGFSLSTRRLELLETPARTLARTGTALASVAVAMPLFVALNVWWALVQDARREYEPRFARRIVLVESAAALLLAALYSAFALRLLGLTWRALDGWSAGVRLDDWTPPKPTRSIAIALTVAALAAVWHLRRILAGTVHNFRRSLRGLGVRRFVRGIPMMILFRLRQPCRDFFAHMPVIGQFWLYAAAALLAAVIPIPLAAVALPAMIALYATLLLFDKLRPPTVLFLGASEFDSFRAFLLLRNNVGPVAFTFIDRESGGGRAAYDVQQRAWRREGALAASLFYDPTAPRVWSLRTRPRLWAHSVRELIDYAPMVVVDLRHASDHVRFEVEYLAEPSLAAKSWFIIGDGGPDASFDGLIPPAAQLMTEEEMLTRTAATEWDPALRAAG